MSIIKHDDRFGNVHYPESLDEIFHIISQERDFFTPVYMWRGQSDASWLLHSGAYRQIAEHRLNKENLVKLRERYLLDKATNRGFRFVDGRELADFELLARLQHHGAATRLLDMTRNALVGLYFACSGNSDKSGMLFGMRSDFLGGSEGSTLRGTYDEVVSGLEKAKHPFTWTPPEVTKRIAAQHSQFIFSTIIEGQKHGSIALSAAPESLLCIEIAHDLKDGILDVLNATFDINHGSLFPDIDGFGQIHSAGRGPYSADRW